jgi:hypothetical protein
MIALWSLQFIATFATGSLDLCNVSYRYPAFPAYNDNGKGTERLGVNRTSSLSSEATKRYCLSSLHHVLPRRGIHRSVSIFHHTGWDQLSAAGVLQPSNKNDEMSIQSSRMRRVENPARVRRLQQLVNLAQELCTLYDRTLGTLPLQGRNLSVDDTSGSCQYLFLLILVVTHWSILRSNTSRYLSLVSGLFLRSSIVAIVPHGNMYFPVNVSE